MLLTLTKHWWLNIFDSVKCLIIDKEINDVSVLPKHYCDTTVRAPAKCMQNSAGMQMSPCTVDVSHEPQCRIDNGAHSFILGILAHETATALLAVNVLSSDVTADITLFEVHKVHGLKIYNTKTSVLHLKKSRKQFYCPLLPLRPMRKILFGPRWISVVAIPCVTSGGNRRVF